MTARAAFEARLAALPEVLVKPSWGEAAHFVKPGCALPSGAYFATIKERDGPNDAASRLGDGRWRISLGIGRAAFAERFGTPPSRPARGGTVEGGWPFDMADRLMPHPVYGWMGWVAAVSPGPALLADVWPLAEIAHARALAAARARLGKLRGSRGPVTPGPDPV